MTWRSLLIYQRPEFRYLRDMYIAGIKFRDYSHIAKIAKLSENNVITWSKLFKGRLALTQG